jgi:large subunit ribosomal protein L29
MRMKAMELRQLSLEELTKRLADEQENLANLRFQLATSQLESPIRVRIVRRDVAKIRTVIREKQAAAGAAAVPPVAPTTTNQHEVTPA